MAAAKATVAAAIGTTQWVQNENEQAEAFIQQEVEEFEYSVRNDLDWLNEHMAEVLAKGGVDFADVFKTPGKLRGKTPRTARKANALAAPRQPLTDLFAPSAQVASVPARVPAQESNAFHNKVAQFEIAEDQENVRPTSRSKSPQRVGKPGNTDSGYHGMTEDEMELDARTETATTASSQQSATQKVPLRENQERPQPTRLETADGGGTSDESFMSAREDLTSRNVSREQLREEQENEKGATLDVQMEVDKENVESASAGVDAENTQPQQMDEGEGDDAPGSPSDASSPEKPLQRKSSFTFSALPAREPLAAKRSIGARNSQIDAGRSSVLGRSYGGQSMSVPNNEDEYKEEKPEEARVHNKTSTQSLHERIMMLGKAKEPRTSKSIPQNVLGTQATYPQLPTMDVNEDMEPDTEPALSVPSVPAKEIETEEVDEDDDDDWIAPSKPAQHKVVTQAAPPSYTPQGSPARPGFHQKSISTTQLPSPTRPTMVMGHQKAQSVSALSLANAAGPSGPRTPLGSPMAKKHHDGPLSASKNKLWSALKSAKSIFASSASTSAAAKLEAHSNSPAPQFSPHHDLAGDPKTSAVFNMPGALYSERPLPHQSPIRPVSQIPASPSRKTRSSSESDKKREKEQRAQQKAAQDLEKARDQERQKVAKEQERKRKANEAEAENKAEGERKVAEAAAQRPTSAGLDRLNDGEMPSAPAKSMLPAGKPRGPGRLVRPTRNEAVPRPAPVSIRVASQSQRLGQGPQSALSKSQHESMAPPPPPKTGLRTTSAQGSARSSTAPNNARVKALEAAARKREADEKAAQKKAEQKRELERKRAAKAEEERRAEEERKAAEQARIQEAKLAAQRKAEQQAAEARKREQQRLEQQRQQEEAQKAKAAYELAEAIKRERAAQAPAHPRSEVGGTLRQLAKNTVQEQQPSRAPVQTNPTKPAKRLFQPDEDEPAQHAPQRPGLPRGPPSYQQNDAKRRRTNEEQEQPAERHSVMAPPKRPSNMRKESTLSKFPHGYTHAPPPAAHHSSSMFKAAVNAPQQHQHAGKSMPSHPSQTVQMSSARIPFAENNNPPGGPHPIYQQPYPGHENAASGASNKFKTPARPPYFAPKSAKSSPMYPKGDNIELPEIATDSEDEESEDDETGGFRAPSWVASPALRDLLTQQQLVDPETVFGPIGELKMDEVFRNGKNQERLKRFRDRGSSAAWVETGDAVTSAEKRRDMEMRERVAREGGWRFEPTT